MENYSFINFQVANLFARDEMDEILGDLIPVMKKEFPRRPPSNENLYEYYLTRVRNNLHVVLCFSPVSYRIFVDYVFVLDKFSFCLTQPLTRMNVFQFYR